MRRCNLSLLLVISLLFLTGCGNSNNSAAKLETPTEATEAVEAENIVEDEPSQPEQAVEIQIQAITSNTFGGAMTVPVVEVTAIVDSVEVQDVVGNRGNCKMTSVRQAEFPRSLQFGEKATAGFTANCNLIQVDVVTDKGTFSFNTTQ